MDFQAIKARTEKSHVRFTREGKQAEIHCRSRKVFLCRVSTSSPLASASIGRGWHDLGELL